MGLIYHDGICLYCMLLFFALFQDTAHKAKEKEKGKSPNPVGKMNDLPFIIA